jgi:predicted DsbA family dithiol-disulfide isomerase
VIWKAYELDPNAPPVREGDYAGRLARKYNVGPEQAQAMIGRIVGAASEAGLTFRYDIARAGNTFDAHRLLHLAGEAGAAVQDAVKERFLVAYFTEGEPIGDHDALARLAIDAGLDPASVDEVLSSDKFAAEVRAEEQVAHDLGVSGVPFFLVDETYGLSGAQPPRIFLNVLRRAWNESHKPAFVPAGDEAPGCDGDACDV